MGDIMKLQIESDTIPFIIYAEPRSNTLAKLVDWVKLKSTRRVDVFIVHTGDDKEVVNYITEHGLDEVIVDKNFKMPELLSAIEIKCPKYFFYVSSNTCPILKCPDNLLDHMISIYDRYPFVHRISCFLDQQYSKQTRDKVCYIGKASIKFALYKMNFSNMKTSNGNLITKPPYRVTDSSDKGSNKPVVKSAAATCKLTNREFSYISTRAGQRSISFLSNTECVLSDGSKGDVEIRDRLVTIRWRSSSKGVSHLNFNELFTEYRGTNNRIGPVHGLISNAVGNSDIRERLPINMTVHNNQKPTPHRRVFKGKKSDYAITPNSYYSLNKPVNILLYTNYYIDPVEARDKEIKKCFNENISNPQIDHIICFIDSNISKPYDSPKITYIYTQTRPTYNVFFDCMRFFSGNNDINILANSDIYFDSSIDLLRHKLHHNSCIALTRWEFNGGNYAIEVGPDSQDTWIFKGHPLIDLKFNFTLGKAGCDNRLAYELGRIGYNVINPVKTIKSIHCHSSGIRRYSRHQNDVIPGPYELVPHSELP